MVANQHLLAQAHEKGDHVEFTFSPADASRRLDIIAEDALRKQLQGERHPFIVAPFGPKPLTIAAYFAVARFCRQGQESHSRPVADIALMSGFQYMSVYSMGKGDISVYAIS